jgi:hypothetical protein
MWGVVDFKSRFAQESFLPDEGNELLNEVQRFQMKNGVSGLPIARGDSPN